MRYVTILGGIRPYQREWLSQDIVAGVTLAALAIPEVMGYTKIAGTPVITGLYTILIPIAAFALFGSSRHLVVGGDSATAAIMYAGHRRAGRRRPAAEHVAVAGAREPQRADRGGVPASSRGIARLGFLANFLSRTVLIGFLTGVGIQVAIGQLGGMLGVPAPNVSPDAFSGTLRKFWLTRLAISADASGRRPSLSVAVLAILVVFERWIKKIPGGLVAVVGAIAVELDLRPRGARRLDPRRRSERPAAHRVAARRGLERHFGPARDLRARCSS